jgi:membrane protease YdiL (CAAX protease family)
VTWIAWAAARAILPSAPARAEVLFLIGTFAPGLVAVTLTEWDEGRPGTLALLSRIFKWQVNARWYLFAVTYIAAIKLSVAVVLRVATGAWPRFGDESIFVMAAALLVSTWVQAGEEVGWRGYALPRLTERFGLAPASVILGIIWASWHLPLFFVRAGDQFGQSFPLYLLQVTALSVASAWLYWRTQGSLLLVMLLHAAVNNTKDIVPSAVQGATDAFALSTSRVAWLTVVFLWIAAGYFLIRMRKVRTLFG